MNKSFKIDMVAPDCPIRNILARICDKWSILVLCTLKQKGTMRFNLLQKNIPDISQRMLTITLHTLEEDGLIHRRVYAEVPPRVEYKLTSLGSSFVSALTNLVVWAENNMNEIFSHREKVTQAKIQDDRSNG